MSDTKLTPFATVARRSLGQRRTSGMNSPTRLDLTRVIQIAIIRALTRIAGRLGTDQPTNTIRTYSAILANHADRTLARLDAKQNQWRGAYRQQSLGDGPQLGEQLQGRGSD